MNPLPFIIIPCPLFSNTYKYNRMRTTTDAGFSVETNAKQCRHICMDRTCMAMHRHPRAAGKRSAIRGPTRQPE